MGSKLNQLQTLLPAGMLTDAEWLQGRGYSRSLVAKYVKSGWLQQPTRGAYRRSGSAPAQDHAPWPLVILSLQQLREPLIAVGGRTALALQSLSPPVSSQVGLEVHLYGPLPPPLWARRLLAPQMVFHRSRLFGDDPLLQTAPSPALLGAHLTHADREGVVGLMSVSTVERAMLEMLDEVPQAVSFHDADRLIASLSNLSPQRLSALLATCRSVKVKRLALWFADRHAHGWTQPLDRAGIDLGVGNRVLEPSGRLDRTYRITVPREMVAA